MTLGNPYCDPLLAFAGPKFTARQQWNPTSLQLQILEQIFREGKRSPGKHKIREVTAELVQRGQISETNVINWFQNRKSRSKGSNCFQDPAQNNVELEVETEVQPLKEKNSENTPTSQKLSSRAENPYT